MLEYIKLCLRIDNDEFDEEINSLINSAKEDLEQSGVSSTYLEEITNALIKDTIKNYVKANFGYDNADRDVFNSAYEHLKAKCAIVYNI